MSIKEHINPDQDTQEFKEVLAQLSCYQKLHDKIKTEWKRFWNEYYNEVLQDEEDIIYELIMTGKYKTKCIHYYGISTVFIKDYLELIARLPESEMFDVQAEWYYEEEGLVPRTDIWLTIFLHDHPYNLQEK